MCQPYLVLLLLSLFGEEPILLPLLSFVPSFDQFPPWHLLQAASEDVPVVLFWRSLGWKACPGVTSVDVQEPRSSASIYKPFALH